MANTSVSELMKRIGWEGLLATSGMHVAVRITNARTSFGRVDYTTVPLQGKGESAWVSSKRFTKDGAQDPNE